MIDSHPRTKLQKAAWEITQPLGVPVDPLVKMMYAVLSEVTSAASASRGVSAVSAAAASVPGVSQQAAESSRDAGKADPSWVTIRRAWILRATVRVRAIGVTVSSG